MELMRSGAAAGVKRAVGVDGRENPWTAAAGAGGGVAALDSTGETLKGTGEPDGGRGGGAGEWQRLTAGLCVGVVRVRSGCETARQWEGKWKIGCCCGEESMAEADIILWIVGRGGTLIDLGCCCCCCPEGFARRPGDAEGSRWGCSALDLTSCLMSGSSRANIVADAMEEKETIGSEATAASTDDDTQ